MAAAQEDDQVPLLRGAEPGQLQEAAPPRRSVLMTVCPYILGNELCERLAYYGLATNLVTYITRVMGGDPAFAAVMVAVFEGTCYNTPIIGALLADSVWGRYKTILVFSCVYLVGVIMLTGSSMVPDSDEDADSANPLQYGLLFGSLAIISLGTGGIKPNVSAFGADQFNEAHPQDRKEKESFFNWFYLAINVGSLFAGTVIVYIQDQVSWTLGFAIPGCAMALAIMIFWAGRTLYRTVLPTESPMTRVVGVVMAAAKNRYARNATPDPSVNAPRVVASRHPPDALNSYHGGHMYREAMQDGDMVGTPHADANGEGGGLPGAMQRQNSMHQMPALACMSYRWLEDAVTEWQTSQGQLVQSGSLAGYTPKQVEEVKLVLRLLPVFATTVFYWTVYTQMGTLFVQQGNLMARDISWGQGQTFKVPSASMSVFNTLSVIVLIYVYDAWLDPMLKKTKRFKMTLLRRQGWGMVIAVLAMGYAGALEMFRLASYQGLEPCPPTVSCTDNSGGEADGSISRSLLSGPAWGGAGLAGPFGGMYAPARGLLYAAAGGAGGYGAGSEGGHLGHCLCANDPSSISIFWQAPAYFLIGASEVLTSIGELEFFYDQAPDVMRSCSMALCLLSTALGSYLAGALTLIVQAASKAATGTEWLPRDLNKGRMDLFFYLLLVIMALNTLMFVWVAVRYQYKAVEHKRHVCREEDLPVPALAGVPGPTRQASGMRVSQSSAARTVPAVRQSSFMSATAPMVIGTGTRLAGGPGYSSVDPEAPDLEVYSRSLAYVPASPNIPAPYR